MLGRGLVLVTMVLVGQVRGEDDLFSSTAEMALLAGREQELVTRLRSYRARLDQRLGEVRTALDEVAWGGEGLVETREELEHLVGGLPREPQMEGVAQGVFLLQETYNLELSSLVRGRVAAPLLSPTSYPGVHALPLQDTDYLGKVAFNRGFYDRAVQWFQATLQVAEQEGRTLNDTKVRLPAILCILFTFVSSSKPDLPLKRNRRWKWGSWAD